jgi:hypothetical protein
MLDSEYNKQEQWRKDVRAFIFALFKHWLWWLSATIGSGFFAFLAAWAQGLPGGGKVIPFWVFGTAAATGLIAASFRAFCDQRRIAEANNLELQNAIKSNDLEKLETARAHAEQKTCLETLINSLRNASSSILSIEVIHPIALDILTSRRTYRIRVKNNHPSKAVKHLMVSVSEIRWPKSVEKPFIWNGIIFPYQLPEKGNPNISASCEIAGDSEKEFDLMFVEFYHGSERFINLAPFLPRNAGSASIYKTVDSNIRFRVGHLPKNDSNLFFTFKVSGGEGDIDTLTESYTLLVPPIDESTIESSVEALNAINKNIDSYIPVFKRTIEGQTETAS